VKDVQTLPGADIGSDHSLLVAKVCTRLKTLIWFQKEKKERRSYMLSGTNCKVL
jgi:hypothetical protein